MSLVDLDTGEIVDQLDEDAARLLTNRIRQCVAVAHESIVHAYRGRAWIALGHPSWDAYCEAEFGGARLPIPKADRSEVVALLRAEGMSTRAISSALGISKNTVTKDVSQSGTPAAVVGIDGRTYPAQQPERADDRGAGEADDREASDIVEPSGPVPGCADDAVSSPAPEPAQHEDEGAADECPPPAAPSAPLPRPLSVEEQRERDRHAEMARRRKELAAIHTNWPALRGLRVHPDRAEILRGLDEADRHFVLDIERRVQWKD